MKRLQILALVAVAACVGTFDCSKAAGQDVKQLQQKKDVPGLMRLLRHHDGKVRSSAAVALSGVIGEVKDSKSLAPHVLPLVDVTLRDPYSTVREYAGRALQHCLRNVTDVSILRGAVPSLVDALNAREVEEKRRRYCAVHLSGLIAKIEYEPLLEQSFPRLLSAALEDPNGDVREYAGRALRSALSRIRDGKLLRTGCMALAKTLQHDDAKLRRYAAVQLAWLAPRVTELETLRAISSRVSEAAAQDRDGDVREYAGRAARYIKQRLQVASSEPKATDCQ